MTANYNRDALTAYRNGELDLALFYANASLRQNLSQPEMHRFREQLTGDRTKHWERNIGHRILLREMDLIPADRLDEIAPVERFDDGRPVAAPPVEQQGADSNESAKAQLDGTLVTGLSASVFGSENDQ